MLPEIGKSNKIRHIVRIRQMVQRWRKKARIAAARALAPPSPTVVPAGHVAVCVGTSCKRFIVRATHLNHPIFKRLLVQAEEEYGFSNQGPLTIPCDESFFEEVLRVVTRSSSTISSAESSSNCHVGIRTHLDFLGESRPLLHGLADTKSICS
ncbi:auxin-responsive protein SAUR71-like [Quercus suber]|uniref:auxin-responsive protein SAUR71-like n=1 Tax=Quercus suber TaxID=58331 RepID=UPI0032DFFD16